MGSNKLGCSIPVIELDMNQYETCVVRVRISQIRTPKNRFRLLNNNNVVAMKVMLRRYRYAPTPATGYISVICHSEVPTSLTSCDVLDHPVLLLDGSCRLRSLHELIEEGVVWLQNDPFIRVILFV